MQLPADPIAAAIHPDPYGYYATLAAERPIAFDPALGMWVAASAEAVNAVLSDRRCRVRPLGEPVPAALLGTAVDHLFRRWVRMNDGPDHDALKQPVSAVLTTVDLSAVETRSRTLAVHLLAAQPLLLGFPFALPAFVIGSLLGIPDRELPNTVIWLDHMASSLAPGRHSSAIIALGDHAASELRMALYGLLQRPTDGRSTLLAALDQQVRAAGIDDPWVAVANGVGFLVQAYEATAGLIGNTIIALAGAPDLRSALAAEPARIEQVVAEVAHADPAIQNTRRYVAEDGVIAGQPMTAGDAILVLLAAANRDPAVPPGSARPAADQERRDFAFGAGPHACPGAELAMTIARAGVEALLARDEYRWPAPGAVPYRPSVNARVPRFAEESFP